ncbi:MAG: pantetheine-phosphate adenylyltransferase [Bryobacterales bacterium]|nr:pantetheine-phosphate adenylyltransferase [Bryobacterales bacterium]
MDIQRHQKAVALYPGSFDPLTFGHIDLIERAARLFDNLIVAVVYNPSKQAVFSVEERIDMLREVCSQYENVEVDSFEGLLVNYAQRRNAAALIRGIRAISDYEYELQMALMNRRLQPKLETVFLMASEEYSFVSSRMVKEVFALGGDVSGLVPATTLERLKLRIKKS